MGALLVIHLGSVNSRAFLIDAYREANSSRSQWYLRRSVSWRSTLKPGTLATLLAQEFKGEFENRVVLRGSKESFSKALSFLSSTGVLLAVEVGASRSFLGIASFGRVEKVVELKLGVGAGVNELFRRTTLARAAGWLPSGSLSAEEVFNYWGMKSLYPQIIPPDPNYQRAELALAREILTQLGREVSAQVRVGSWERFTPTLLLSGEVFAAAADTGWVSHALLDGLNLSGIWNLWLDKSNILHSLSQLAWGVFPKAQLGMVNLGTLIILEHRLKEGFSLGKLQLDLGLDEPLELELVSNEIVRIPFEEGGSGRLRLSLAPAVKLSGNAGVTLVGGKQGIIVDARLKPVEPSFNPHWEEALSLG